ncbi:MAG TPA: aminopeptidase, partial [Gaiellaceae bacterium]|nr:aminopeptidase [Gaiellaceae bacterium]
MPDTRLEKLADVLVGYSTEVRAGDVVRLAGTPPTSPLLRELYRASLRAGGHPEAVLVVNEAAEALLTEGADEQVGWVPLDFRWTLEHADVWVVLDGPENTKHLSGAEAAKMAQHVRAREPYQNRYMERSARGEFRWVYCACPTQASAQAAGMTLPQFERLVYGAALLDADDPVAAWRSFGDRLDRIAEFLAGVREL